jgi:hypothetical protein
MLNQINSNIKGRMNDIFSPVLLSTYEQQNDAQTFEEFFFCEGTSPWLIRLTDLISLSLHYYYINCWKVLILLMSFLYYFKVFIYPLQVELIISNLFHVNDTDLTQLEEVRF